MANKKSSEKRIRVAERRRLRNKPHRTAARTTVRRANEAIVGGDQTAAVAAVAAAISTLDRVASKGVIHK
ncbi:MAG: 30S ribosomal protein S20, partial [Chloroflexota bacterium]|nr:30S ribosomal protein S20 [Chloroflexota bacterium]